MSRFENSQRCAAMRSALSKAADASIRLADSIGVDAAGELKTDYALKQCLIALSHLSAVRLVLEQSIARGQPELAKELARKRLADPAYVPTLNEVIDDPDGFSDRSEGLQ